MLFEEDDVAAAAKIKLQCCTIVYKPNSNSFALLQFTILVHDLKDRVQSNWWASIIFFRKDVQLFLIFFANSIQKWHTEMKDWWLLVIAVQMIRPMIYLNWELGPIQKFLSTYHTRRWDISLNFLIPTYCYELKEIWNHVHNADAMALSFHHGLDSIYMKDLVDWPLMTTKNIKFMTKQDHLLRNFITGMSSSEQPFFL